MVLLRRRGIVHEGFDGRSDPLAGEHGYVLGARKTGHESFEETRAPEVGPVPPWPMLRNDQLIVEGATNYYAYLSSPSRKIRLEWHCC